MGSTFDSDKCFSLIHRPQLGHAKIVAVHHSVAQLIRFLYYCNFRVDALAGATEGRDVIQLLHWRNDFPALAGFSLFSTFRASFRMSSVRVSSRTGHSTEVTSWLHEEVGRGRNLCVFNFPRWSSTLGVRGKNMSSNSSIDDYTLFYGIASPAQGSWPW
ncbi:hypothetical protein ACHAXS_006901 [Conticribra weissflogii]